MKIFKRFPWKRIFLSVFFILVVSLFLAPRIAKRYLVNHSDTLIGRSLEIQKIRINYFSGVLRIIDFDLYEKDAESPFISFDKLLVNLDYWPLFRNELFLSEISLVNLYSQVTQKGEIFNFSDLVVSNDSVSVDEFNTEVDSTTSSMIYTVHNITISGSTLQYQDIVLDHLIVLDDIDLFIPGFTWNSGSTNLDMDFRFKKGGGFYSKLGFNQADSSFLVNLQLDSLNIDVIEPYIKESLKISEINGYFSNNINLEGNLKHIGQLRMSGWNKVDELAIFDTLNRQVLSFDNLLIDVDSFQLDQNYLILKEVAIVNPQILFELIDSTNNWLAMLVDNDSLSDEVELDTINADTEAPFSYSLTQLKVTNGTLLFSDLTLSEKFESTIHNITIISNDLSVSSEKVDFKIGAEINQTGIITSDILINPSNMEEMDFELSLQKFAMSDVEPYFIHYFGYPVEEGLLNFTTKNKLEAKSIISENNVYLRKFELGNPEKDNAEFKLPLRLALGILSDKDGVIDLNLPVESTNEETSISNLGKLIGKTIGSLFLKAATSPADLLSVFYNIDPDKLKVVKFGMFDAMPEKEEMESLDLIAQILNDKPQLRIELIHSLPKVNFYDSLAYLSSRDVFRNNQKHTINEIADSALHIFLEKELAGKNLVLDTNLRKLCLQFTSDEFLSRQYDSVQIQQSDFINDYLIHHKEISEERINISNEAHDSLSHSSREALFYVNFKSLNSE